MSYFSYENNGRGGFFGSIPPAIKNIIIINVLVMVMITLKENWMITNFALFYPSSPFFKPWQIVTHMFMHGGFWHIFFNMYTLFIFGTVLERIWGTKKFLIFYFVTGIGAALLHTGDNADPAPNKGAIGTTTHGNALPKRKVWSSDSRLSYVEGRPFVSKFRGSNVRRLFRPGQHILRRTRRLIRQIQRPGAHRRVRFGIVQLTGKLVGFLLHGVRPPRE